MRRFFRAKGDRDPKALGTGGRRLPTTTNTDDDDRGVFRGSHRRFAGFFCRGGWHDDRGRRRDDFDDDFDDDDVYRRPTSSFQKDVSGTGGGRDPSRSRERYHHRQHHAFPPVVRGGRGRGGGEQRRAFSPYDRNVFGNTGGRCFDTEVGGSGFSRARRNGGRGYAAAAARRNDRSMHDNRRPMIHQTRRSAKKWPKGVASNEDAEATTREGSVSDAKKKKPTAQKEKSEKELEDDLEAYFAEGRSLKEKAAKEAVLTSGE